MTTYRCDDGNAEIEIEADSAQDAAQEYVDGGSWGEVESTIWITVYVESDDSEREGITIALDPTEPDCEASEHDWRSPLSLVGGIKENPGVQGHGGGVVIHEVCGYCGSHRHRDTWAQNPETGEQGLDSVSYDEADAESRAYADKRVRRLIGEALESVEHAGLTEALESEHGETLRTEIVDMIVYSVLPELGGSRELPSLVAAEFSRRDRAREIINAAYSAANITESDDA